MTSNLSVEKKETESLVTSPISQFIERLKLLSVMLERNSYIKSTTNLLNLLIKDAQSPHMVLVLGKERVGKTTLINALIGRNLLCASTSHPTAANTFVCYGEEECIKAYFFDGMVATFDIDKIDLFTISDTFIAQIIREHLSYIEIFIKDDRLKDIVLIDTVALEMGGDVSAYFSESLIDRVDEVFWVLRSGSIATDSELALLKKMQEKEIKPYFLVNATDSFEGDIDYFIKSEKERYGQYVEDFHHISALQAIEAREHQNNEMLLHSNYNAIESLLQKVSKNDASRARKVMKRFAQWMTVLQIEIESIPQKEPFSSAVEKIRNYKDLSTFEYTREQRDLAVVSAYEQEYEKVSKVFENIQTLYQLLQVLDSEYYLRDEAIEAFEETAISYHQVVRDYRNLHSEYMSQYSAFDQQKNKVQSKGIMKSIFRDQSQGELLKVNAEKLNTLQQQCEQLLKKVKEQETIVVSQLYSIQNHITELAKKRLRGILIQVGQLDVQRRRERQHMKSYAYKLEEFKPIVEVQGFLRDAIQPAIVSGDLPLEQEEVEKIVQSIDRILTVNLSEIGLMSHLSSVKEYEEEPIQTDFESKYPLYSLNLTEADILSELPELPSPIVIE